MIDAENIVFTTVVAPLRAAFTGIFATGEKVAIPAKFPCVTLVEDDNATYEKSLDSNMTENHATLMYTANAYSNLLPGKKSQCKAIMAIIDTQMLQMGFVRVGSGPIEMPNADANIYRMVARYRGVISAKTISGSSTTYQIYRR